MTSKLAVLFAAFASLITPGCGCCDDDDHHHHDYGTLEIVNDDATDVIETVELEDLYDPYHEFIDVDLFPGDSVEIDLFPSTYEVTLYWDNVVVTSSTEDIFEDETLTIFVSN
jgi:hypothetical protein